MSAAAPDYIEPVVGWRAWLVVATEDGLRLRSVARRAYWEPGERFTATCLRIPRLRDYVYRVRARSHDVPAVGCSCGVYAARDAATAVRYADCADEPGATLGRVLGEVCLWGTVVEGSAGWRASLAYPKRLVVPAWTTVGHGGDSLTAGRVAAALDAYGAPTAVVECSSAVDLTLALDGDPALLRRFHRPFFPLTRQVEKRA